MYVAAPGRRGVPIPPSISVFPCLLLSTAQQAASHCPGESAQLYLHQEFVAANA